MAPRVVVFDRQAIVTAALQIVREAGWEAMTARSVAGKLGASVAPVYKAFGAMADLEQAVLEEARRLLEERTREKYTEMDFLNIGVGVVQFARDEPNLFRALYQVRHGRADIVQAITDSMLDRMRKQPMLERLPDESLRRLLDNVRLYTLGLATALVAGWWSATSGDEIVRRLMDVGHVFSLAEAGGTAECGSPASRAAWKRLLGADSGPNGSCPMARREEMPPRGENLNNNRFFEED